MITLQKADKIHDGLVRLEYVVSHSTLGRDGTTLSAALYLRVTSGWSEAVLMVPECSGSTPQEAIDRLATWLGRLKESIENRTETMLPL